jgi:hypothetical protein
MAILKTYEGINLMDPGKGTFDSGTESWAAMGGNTIVNDEGALKITYINADDGATISLNAASDLNTNLVIGKTYKLSYKIKSNGTGNYRMYLYNAPSSVVPDFDNNTEYEWKSIEFTANSTTGVIFRGSNWTTVGCIVWIDQWYIQEWYPDGKVLKYYDPEQPLNIDTSCQVWLDGNDADTFTLDGTSVDQWDDKSGFGRDVSNGNADTTRPTYDSATGRVTFTAANSTFLQSAAFNLTQPVTVFIVVKYIFR